MNNDSKQNPCAVIITAIPLEFKAVCAHLKDLQEVVHPKGMVYEKGIFKGENGLWEVLVAEVGAGNIKCCLETERAVEHFKAKVAIFVGIAGGFKDDITFGDVVVGEKAYEYEAGKIQNGVMLTRPEIGKSTYAILQRAKAVARKEEWKIRIKNPDKSLFPKVIVKPIAAGEKVIADSRSEIAELLRTHYNDTAAIEMEGYGFYKVIEETEGLYGLIVRGISDMLDNKDDRFQEVAARNASAFAFEVLSKFTMK